MTPPLPDDPAGGDPALPDPTWPASDDAARETILFPTPAAGATALVQVPFQFFTTGEDHLRLTTWNSRPGANVKVSGRFLSRDGTISPFVHTFTCDNTRLPKRFFVALGVGALLNVTVGGDVIISTGSTFVKLEVVRGFSGALTPLGTLVQAYIGESRSQSWPGSVLESPTGGAGEQVTVGGTDPAAGVEISETVPVAARWRVNSFRAQLTTDATVINRRPLLVLDDDGTFQFARIASSAAQGASQTMNYLWNQGVYVDPVVTEQGQGLLPIAGHLVGGWRVRTATVNLQAGDNWSAPQWTVSEWLEAFDL